MKKLTRIRTLFGRFCWVRAAALADHRLWPLYVPLCNARGRETGLFVLRAYIDRVL